MAAESEKIYECQVKRRRLKLGGGYEPFWKLKSVTEALSDADTEFRCSECTGAVRAAPLPCGRRASAVPHPQVQERLRILPCGPDLPPVHRRPPGAHVRTPRSVGYERWG